jgi:hypothetical protein
MATRRRRQQGRQEAAHLVERHRQVGVGEEHVFTARL